MTGTCGGQLAGRQVEVEVTIARGDTTPARFARRLDVCPMLVYVALRELDRINAEPDVTDAEARFNRKVGKTGVRQRQLDEIESCRRAAADLIAAGATPRAVAQRLGKNPDTVRRWMRELRVRASTDLARTG